MSKTATVIGGGIGGLSLAWRLQKQGYTVNIYDSNQHWGGVTETAEEHGCVLELGPDSIIRTKPAAMTLIKELGIENQVQETVTQNRQALIARGNRLVAVPPGLYLMAPGKIWPFICSPIVSLGGKFRMLLDLVLPRSKQDHDESLADFVRRRLGKEALERIAQPMVGGIYTADPEHLSLRACMPQFIEMEREHRSLIKAMMIRGKAQKKANPKANAGTSGPRYGLFISLKGGLQSLAHALISHFKADQLHAGYSANNVTKENGRWMSEFSNGEKIESDIVCLCGPAHSHADLLATHNRELSDAISQIPYANVATINLGFATADIPAVPAASGFVIPAIEKRSMIACTFSSNKYANRSADGTTVLRAFVGGALQGHQLERSDAEIISAVLDDLKDLCKITAKPTFSKITRYSKAMAQPSIGHLERVAKIRELQQAEEGLYLIGNGYEGVGIPDIIQQGMEVCKNLLDQGDEHVERRNK